jgi:hypothetical protein
MAIQAPIQTQFGVPATYWHIRHLVNDFQSNGVIVFLAGYASAEARRDGKEPLTVLQEIRLPGLKASDEPRRGEIYAALIAYAATLSDDHPQAVLIPLANGEAV